MRKILSLIGIITLILSQNIACAITTNNNTLYTNSQISTQRKNDVYGNRYQNSNTPTYNAYGNKYQNTNTPAYNAYGNRFQNANTPTYNTYGNKYQNMNNSIYDVFENYQNINEPTYDAFENRYQNSSRNTNITNLSPIEELFNGKDPDIISRNILNQVGYDLFSFPSLTTSSTGKYEGTYKLSVGEKVNVYLYGDSLDIMAISGTNLLSPEIKTEVDSSGNIFIQGLGVFPAENKTISEIEQSMNKIASGKYRNLKVRLSIGSGQEMSVFVYGQVNKPGKVYINNNSSIFDALGAAGGVKKTGTLRNITYTSGIKSQNVDLYNTIFLGIDNNIILKPNDKIFVSNIGKVVAIKNGVTVPGIYEIKNSDTLQKLVDFAGGLLPGTQTSEITITSLDTDTLGRTAKNMQWKQAKTNKLESGDTIEFRELYNTAENTVILQGNVKHPATYAYKSGMRLSDILPNEKELLEETFISQAVIRRVSGQDNSIETIPVFLKEFFSGINDPLLQPKDIITVFKKTNTDFVDVYGCISTPKHIPYVEGMDLKDILVDIKYVESTLDYEKENNEVEVKSTSKMGVLAVETKVVDRMIPAEQIAVEIIGKDKSVQIYYLYDIMINSSDMDKISLFPQDKIFFRKLRDDEKIKHVQITGYVNTPSSFSFIEGQKLIDIIIKAGGLKKDADLRGIVYKRKSIATNQISLARKNNERDISLIEGKLASGYKQTAEAMDAKTDMITQIKAEQNTLENKYDGRIALDIKDNNLDKIKKIDNIEVQDGDEIYIPRMPRHVSIQGEVYNEQAFIYIKGKTYKQYLKNVGGYTPNAAKFRVYKVGVNGKAQRVHRNTKIALGDTVIVPRKIAGNDWIGPVCSTLQSIAAILSGIFIITKI